MSFFRNVAILVDGGFYLKNNRSVSANIHDPDKVISALVRQCSKHIDRDHNNERLYRVFFYDCPPLLKKAEHPLTGKSIDFSRTDTAKFRLALHEQIKKTQNFALRLGRLDEENARWKIKQSGEERKFIAGKIDKLQSTDIVYYAQQKQVDMKVGIDIASLAYKKLVDKIVLISGDSDFIPAAKLARKEGIEFVLDSMGAPIKEGLSEHVDNMHTTIDHSPR